MIKREKSMKGKIFKNYDDPDAAKAAEQASMRNSWSEWGQSVLGDVTKSWLKKDSWIADTTEEQKRQAAAAASAAETAAADARSKSKGNSVSTYVIIALAAVAVVLVAVVVLKKRQ